MSNCIHELLNVFEDSAQREHTIVAQVYALGDCYIRVSKRSNCIHTPHVVGVIMFFHGKKLACLTISSIDCLPKGVTAYTVQGLLIQGW